MNCKVYSIQISWVGLKLKGLLQLNGKKIKLKIVDWIH